MVKTTHHVSRLRTYLAAFACLTLGFIGGILGAQTRSDSSAQNSSSLLTIGAGVKAATVTTSAQPAPTLKPGTVTIPKTLPVQQVQPGPQGPAGPAGPVGPAGKDGIGFKSIQWIPVGGEFSGCCGEWLVSCPANTSPITWQVKGISGATISYAGQGFYNDNPNEWMFRASDNRGTLNFTTPSARFALGCITIG